MKQLIENLKGNSFFFMCMMTGAISVIIVTDSNPPMAYVSGLLFGWIGVSILGVNIEKSQKESKAASGKEE